MPSVSIDLGHVEQNSVLSILFELKAINPSAHMLSVVLRRAYIATALTLVIPEACRVALHREPNLGCLDTESHCEMSCIGSIQWLRRDVCLDEIQMRRVRTCRELKAAVLGNRHVQNAPAEFDIKFERAIHT